MIIFRQNLNSDHSGTSIKWDNKGKVRLDEDAANSPTTKEDIKYAKKGMKEYVKNTKNAPKAKHFRVLDKETGEWRDGTKEDAKKFLSPEALKAQHDALIYESKLNRLNNKK